MWIRRVNIIENTFALFRLDNLRGDLRAKLGSLSGGQGFTFLFPLEVIENILAMLMLAPPTNISL